ncbi:MAG: DUF4093 domain-containing protein [Ruminococcaceae bacterium]|nr:DUF4093 domain-containing protein [Oscillospiraceae bacterium]
MKLSSVIDATVITTDGFGVFKGKDKLSLIKSISKNGVIILTDSDGAGKVIRAHLSGAIPKEKIYNLYIPQVKGKERRKKEGSKEGTLGVEGMEADLLRDLFSDFVKNHPFEGNTSSVGGITKADLFEGGFTGNADSRELRDAFASSLNLPRGLTPTAFLDALNTIISRDEYFEKLQNEKQQKGEC